MIDIETVATIIISVAIGLLLAYLRSIDEKVSEIKATVHPEVVKTRDKLDEIKVAIAELKMMLTVFNHGK
jgi:hypothetical protein